MKKNILLTGASSGIGQNIAQTLADNGFQVLATVRKIEDKINLEKLNPNIKVFLADLTNLGEIKKLKIEINKEYKNIDGIINNAGMAFTGLMEYAQIDELKAQFEINTFAPLLIVKEFLPMMSKGTIINMSSVSSNVVYPFISPYCASKRALDIFFQALEIEIDNPDIKIVSIKPSVVKTPIWEKSYNAALKRFEKLPQEIQEKYNARLQRLLKKSENCIKFGLEPEAISQLILKILNCKNPKPSYCIGFGSHLGAIINKLPISWQIKLSKKLN